MHLLFANDTPKRLQRFKQSHRLPDDWRLPQGTDVETRALSRHLDVRTIFEDTYIDYTVRIAVFDANGRPILGFTDWSFDTAVLLAHK